MGRFIFILILIFTPLISYSQIKILDWNIFMRPEILFDDDQSERADEIINFIQSENFDIILFQESFDKKITQRIIAGLDYPYQVLPKLNDNRLLNNGLLILSKIHIDLQEIIFFNDCRSFDCMSSKGAILIQITFNNQLIQIVNTHLQSEDKQWSIRQKQILQINDLLDKFNSLNGNILQILAGDINEPHQMTQVESILTMNSIIKDVVTWGCPKNLITKKESKPQLLDHILINIPHQISKSIPFICLSDHYPIIFNLLNKE